MGSESQNGVEVFQIDEVYEFSAPRFFDFIDGESAEEIKKAEQWFEISKSYAPSPFMQKIKEGRTIKIDSLLCGFENVEQMEENNVREDNSATGTDNLRDELGRINVQQNISDNKISFEFAPAAKPTANQEEESIKETHGLNRMNVQQNTSDNKISFEVAPTAKPSSNQEEKSIKETPISNQEKKSSKEKSSTFPVSTESTNIGKSCTSKAYTSASVSCTPKTNGYMDVAGKKASGAIKSACASKTPYAQSAKSTRLKSTVKCPDSIAAKKSAVKNILQENQAIKKQKLECGNSKQILNVKTRMLHHKSKPDSEVSTGSLGSCRDLTVCKEQVPFISAAEMVNKFLSKTREIDFSQKSTSHEQTEWIIHNRPKLKLTRPIEPELETSQRVRAIRIKSSAELEEEMLANVPKFKARPLNKKILESPSLPSFPRTTLQPFEFQEFHLKTMERANQISEASSVISSDSSSQNHHKPPKLAEPKPPCLQTSLRARPSKIKPSTELEIEELEKIPKFKARPLNKKIFESKGDLGLPVIQKPQATTPKEFHFATEERLGPSIVNDMFDKLSLHSDSSSQFSKHEIPRITTPNPFNLRTEERGHEKEKQFTVQILQRQIEEEKARIPKATPYPYTTDYPVVPPKPEPKPCTKPEGFQLESLIRHEEELHRKMEERERMEREEARRRLFKAQPILREDPIPLPKKERRPLTDIQEFDLHVDHRAVERSEFDKKVKEKEMMYKRLREENENMKMIEEQKELKHMRREMVPHARPVPKFSNPFVPQKSVKDLTRAKSPVLRVKQREERRRHALR